MNSGRFGHSSRELTSPSALFSSSSFCLAWSSAMRCSMVLSDSRVNGRNRLFSSLENEESVSAMDMVECTSYTLVGLPPPDCWRGLKHVNPLEERLNDQTINVKIFKPGLRILTLKNDPQYLQHTQKKKYINPLNVLD